MKINERIIGAGAPAYIIAELSANHHQDFAQAEALVLAAKAAGADAVKLQTYTPDTITINSDKPYFQIGAGTIWQGRNLYELYGEAYTPWEWQPRLQQIAIGAGLDFFSTPFDDSSVDFLEGLDVPAYKIASFELVDLPLIRRAARTGKPLIMSTGMATVEEIVEAVEAARNAGATGLALLKCTSAYPAAPDQMNLRTIPDLARRFEVPVGISDHTLGIAVVAAAVTLGACIIEKHLTLSRSVPGPDSAFSLEPPEFKAMVESVRAVEQALGQVRYGATDAEAVTVIFRKSLFVVQDVKAGELFTEQNLRSIRPGHGLAPKHLERVLGRAATTDIDRGTPLQWSHFAEAEVCR